MSAPTPAGDEQLVELDEHQRDEPPLHRPRPCPACGHESRAIVDGRCLRCRRGASS